MARYVCPRYGEHVGRKPCRLQIVPLRASLSRPEQEPSSWLSSLADWAISKQEVLQVAVRSNHNSSNVLRICSVTSQLEQLLALKQIWEFGPGGGQTIPIFANTDLSISVHQSSSSALKASSPWNERGALKIKVEQDVLSNLCTFVPGMSAFEVPFVSFPLTHDARPVGSIDLLLRVVPDMNFAMLPLLEGIRSHGVPLRELIGHSDAVIGCAVSPSGNQIITVSGDNRGIIWDALSGAKVRELIGHNDWVQDCAVFPGGDKIVTVSFDKTAIVWDVQSGDILLHLEGHTDWVKGCDVFPQGNKIVTVSFDKTAIIWDAHTGKLEQRLKGHEQWINACAVFPDGTRLVTVSTDCSGLVWNVRCGRVLLELKGHADSVEGCSVFPNSAKLVTVSRDRSGIIWDACTGDILQRLLGHDDWVQGCAVFPCGPEADLGTNDEVEPQIPHDVASQDCIAVAAKEKVVTVSSDHRGIIWDARTGAKLQTLAGHKNLVHACAVFPKGGKLVTVSGDEKAIVWDVRSVVDLWVL